MVEVENQAGVGFINDHMVGNLKIVKTSSDGRVEGFSFRITGENYDEVFTTDANGEIFIENLRIGKYTVTEVEDSVSAGYKRPDPFEIELTADETLTVNVHNDKVTTNHPDSPKTGDDSHMALWVSLMLASLGVLIGTILYSRKKRGKAMKTKLAKGILLILSLLCILCVPVTPVYAVQQGTDGSELQVVKAEQLEIQLGTAWSGVEFQLKTDAGVYPGAVKVGTDGVLRLEIGGSSQYILTCMNSSTSLPEPEDTADSTDRTQAPATTEQSPESNEKAESGIPTLHIILFAGGMVIAIGTLIVTQILKKKRENKAPDDEEDEE